MEGRRTYRWCFERHCFQDLFNKTRSILVKFLFSFFSIRLVSVLVVLPYSRIDTAAAGEKCVLFHRLGLTSIWSMSSLVTYSYHFQLRRSCFRGRWTCLLVSEIHHLLWRLMYSFLPAFTWRLIPLAILIRDPKNITTPAHCESGCYDNEEVTPYSLKMFSICFTNKPNIKKREREGRGKCQQ